MAAPSASPVGRYAVSGDATDQLLLIVTVIGAEVVVLPT